MINDVLREELYYQALFGLLKIKSQDKKLQHRNKKTKLQNGVLKEVYKLNMYPSASTKSDLSVLLKLSMKTINVWFQNERQSAKMSSEMMRETRREVTSITIYQIYKRIREELNK